MWLHISINVCHISSKIKWMINIRPKEIYFLFRIVLYLGDVLLHGFGFSIFPFSDFKSAGGYSSNPMSCISVCVQELPSISKNSHNSVSTFLHSSFTWQDPPHSISLQLKDLWCQIFSMLGCYWTHPSTQMSPSLTPFKSQLKTHLHVF